MVQELWVSRLHYTSLNLLHILVINHIYLICTIKNKNFITLLYYIANCKYLLFNFKFKIYLYIFTNSP